MIFTIGYARLRPERLDAILDDLDAQLVNVRARPWSRIPGWSRAALEARYGARYLWKGDVLGGGPYVTEDARPADLWPVGLPWLAAVRKPVMAAVPGRSSLGTVTATTWRAACAGR